MINFGKKHLLQIHLRIFESFCLSLIYFVSIKVSKTGNCARNPRKRKRKRKRKKKALSSVSCFWHAAGCLGVATVNYQPHLNF